jgi:Asp-tRNA(Asn)/Glu-tRNA(Gln) amidotransferase A subunit family amidase
VSEHPQDLSLREQVRAVAAGELDATELLEATLERIEQRDPPLNSVVDRFASESARMLAEAPEGRLHGVPIAIKDEYALPWRAPRDGAHRNPIGMEARESGMFRRLREAGAVVVATTNMHELGIGSTGHISVYGPCGNPWSSSRCAGGSSGGSAAAVGARIVGGAIGADGGGSIRFPSAYCGVTGLKFTWGRIPADGFVSEHSSLSTAGPICRDAGDTRLLGEALLATSLEARPAQGLRIGVPRQQLWGDLDPEVERHCSAAIELLREAGVQVEEVSIAGVEHAAIATVLPLSLELLPSAKPEAVTKLVPNLSPIGRALMKYGLLIPGPALVRAHRVRAQIRRSLADAFAGLDAVAWPSLPAPAPAIEDTTVQLPSGQYPADYANVRLGGIANLAGTPAISIPCGFSDAGLPVGLQLLAPWGEDSRLLDIAELFEQASERRYVDAVPPLAEKAAA